ncbi:Outer membrane protein OprM precursor [Gimesia maris]|uniref:TolC family protein n=1 Tax=Gimesia maris TaxID=122 RepID=UPI00118BFA08|nr:efflux transporter outer membrane subunit [Gimesia maris]QDU15941.1 Outer membrane protein OprM precursor [Gimesia maris]
MPDTFNGSYDETNSAELDFAVLFDDPMLSGLIDQAMVDNQELKILAQDIDIANNEAYGWTGSYLPFLNLRAGAGIDKPGRYTRSGAVEDQLQIAPGKGFPEPLPNFLLAADISWEIDIWRKLRNSRDAASLRYLATEEGRNYITTRLIAEIAENYYELLALDKRLETLDITIGLQERSLEVAKANKEAARGTELAVQRFQAEVRKNQSEKLIIQQRLIETENRINFLAGRYPQSVERKQVDFFELNMHTINIGVPSQMLNNRADIRQAERELQAAGLEIQVARARFYPSLVLNAGVGYSAFNPRYLFITPESLVYNAVGELVAPVINRRAIKADYLNANARQMQAVYKYQRTVLNAFTEVVNRINKVENYGKSVEIKKQQLRALEESVDVATKLFQNARAEYVDVLLAQRDLQDAKVVLIETKQQQLAAIVNTYQALGGGGVIPTYDYGRVTITDEQYVPPMLEEDASPAVDGVVPPMLKEEE